LLGNGSQNSQGLYDLSLAVSPLNANILFAGGINTWISQNGGNTWTQVPGETTHVDKHMLKYRNDGTLFECNDGGLNLTADNGVSWKNKTNGLAISQMYRLGNSATNPDEIITGLQDNNTQLLSGSWSTLTGGDGMECLIDYTDPNVQYSSMQNGTSIWRTTNHWLSSTKITPPVAAGSGAWVTPFVIDPKDNQTLYAGYRDVWKSTDRGTSWTKISSFTVLNALQSLVVAPSDNAYLYTGAYSELFRTTDGGATWTRVTGTMPLLSSIAVKNDNPTTLWITVSDYKLNNVFQSVDGGANWTNISTGLPQIPVYSIVQNRQSTKEVQLYAGTELGVYFKKGNDNWVAYNSGLPNVRIGEIEIYYAANPRESRIRAATYGRGLWESGVYYDNTTFGIDEAEVSPTLIYPNPTDGVFSIKSPGPIKKVTVSDIMGRKIDETLNPGNEHKYEYKLSKGVYFIHISTADREFVRKIIVQGR
jgi:photosystem II stability/assembly factor-like uncharacterized protein